MEMTGVDVAFVQETKTVDPTFATANLRVILFWRRRQTARDEGGRPFWGRSGMDSG